MLSVAPVHMCGFFPLCVQVKLYCLKIILILLDFKSFPLISFFLVLFHAFTTVYFYLEMVVRVTWGTNRYSAAQCKCIFEKGKMQQGSIFAAFMHSVPMK